VKFSSAPDKHLPLYLSVKGLKGGHSGLEIDKGRGNAIKILNRTILALDSVGGRLSSFDGGNKRNAIPREANAVIYVPKKKLSEAMHIVKSCNDTMRAELASVEPDLAVTATEPEGIKKRNVIKRAQQDMITRTISALPHGVMKMSADIPGLVETSTNVAVINTTKKAIILGTSQRSSVASENTELCHTVGSVFLLGGAKIEQSDGYPGWKPNLDSKILKIAKNTYKELYGKEPLIKAIHAGLECGIIGEKYPGMDMVSFGPTLEGVHSPDEKIHIDTVEKFWKFLLAILKNVN
jgi:dipeptidase D